MFHEWATHVTSQLGDRFLGTILPATDVSDEAATRQQIEAGACSAIDCLLAIVVCFTNTTSSRKSSRHHHHSYPNKRGGCSSPPTPFVRICLRDLLVSRHVRRYTWAKDERIAVSSIWDIFRQALVLELAASILASEVTKHAVNYH